MKIIDKILYIRAIWFVVAGIFAILISVKFCSNQPKSLDDFETICGKVTGIEHVDLYSRTFNSVMNCTVLYVDSIATAYIYGSKHQAILNTTVINNGDYCQVWGEMEIREFIQSEEKVKYKIRALSINGKQIISFKRQRFLSIYLFFYVLIILVPALFFVIKHPEILVSKKKIVTNDGS